MTTYTPDKTSPSWGHWLSEAAWQLIPPGAYFILVLIFYPQWNAFWIYYDEGYSLMKAFLVERGYHLYSQIWSDQPPLLTDLLAYLFRVNGPSVYASRVVTLLLSCLLIWAAVQYLRLGWGNHAALAGFFLLILLPYFISLSIAVLEGQPSLAMAMASLLFIGLWHRRRARIFLIASALALGTSVLIKLFTLFLAPIYLGGLLLAEYTRSGSQRKWLQISQPALLWGLVFAFFTVLVGTLLAGPGDVMQLVRPHWQASKVIVENAPGSQNYPITFYLQDAWSILLLALVGAAYAIWQRRWLMLYPMVWMITAFIILLNIRPVWFHHQLLITLPAAMLAGGAAAETIRIIPRAIRSPASMGHLWIWLAGGLTAIMLVLANLPIQASSQFLSTEKTGEQRAPYEERVMRRISQYADQTKWMVTDLPMYAFRAGIPVPPELAVISAKRIAAGELSGSELLNAVQEYKPEQVLLGRFDFPELQEYLAENYYLILERPGELKLYARQDLLR